MSVPSGQASIPSSPTVRRLARPRWLDFRVVVGVVLVIGSMLVGARVVAAADDRVGVVAVRSSLRAGTQLSSGELVTVRVALNSSERARYVSVPNAAIGKRLVRDVGAGELVALSALQETPDLTTLVVPLKGDAAPSLSAGQRVTVWLTAAACGTHVLLADATVQSVHHNDSGAFDDGGGQSIVVSVDSTRATLVVTALAIDDASLHAGRIDGAPPTSTETPFDVAGCASSGQ